jgi:DNA-directed RNA polymerase II subunit RPB2
MNNDITWNSLVSCETAFNKHDTLEDRSIVEYIDTEEANTLLLAMKLNDLTKGLKSNYLPKYYTHLEMHPALSLGVLASNIPFPDHNQAPRNCYQSSMGKQAIGVYSSNYKERLDTMGNILNYPQIPLIRTRMSDILQCNELPCGVNVIVAIMTYTGFNQEDSVMLNKSALDRGLFNSTYYRTYKDQCNKNHSTGEEEKFCKPDFLKTKGIKPFNYEKLDESGFIPEDTLVTPNDIIIGKVMPNKVNNLFDYKDNSTPIKTTEACFIDANCTNNRYFKNTNNEGYVFAKIRTRSYRIPTIGDKLSCYSPDHDI